MKKIAILGSTGSIGESTLRVIRHLKKEFTVTALAAKSNIDLLESQAKEFQPQLIAVFDEDKALELKKRLPNIKVVAGMDGLKEVAAQSSADFVVSAMSGTLGLVPTVAAIQAGKNIGLANKEALVSGGALVMRLAKEKGIQLLPIDSEHSAIFQCLNGEKQAEVNRIIITASGGPFRNFTTEQLASVTVDQALCHPTWKMGPKVTIDSSTLMNKGLEVIEAHWLFNMPIEKIEVIVHPQSIIHSMVEYTDGSIIAQMGEPSMIVPIQYALTYPHRRPGLLPKFDFIKNNTLQFYPPDLLKFPCLRLAFEAIKKGGSLSCYMNAANEILVHQCLARKISWQDIPRKLEALMSNHSITPINSLQDALAIDALARQEAADV